MRVSVCLDIYFPPFRPMRERAEAARRLESRNGQLKITGSNEIINSAVAWLAGMFAGGGRRGEDQVSETVGMRRLRQANKTEPPVAKSFLV